MSTDLLTLSQWLSPAYPVGGFAYSHGLEAAISEGVITNGDDLTDWLRDILAHGSGRTDCIVMRAAFESTPDGLPHINDTGLAFAASAERRLESQVQGTAFCKTTTAIWGGADTGYIYPVALGAAAAKNCLDVRLAAAMYLQAMVTNLVACAQRLMPLGQTDGQAIVAHLTPLCDEIARETEGQTLDDLHSTAFLSDIASMHHETQQPRIFRT